MYTTTSVTAHQDHRILGWHQTGQAGTPVQVATITNTRISPRSIQTVHYLLPLFISHIPLLLLHQTNNKRWFMWLNYTRIQSRPCQNRFSVQKGTRPYRQTVIIVLAYFWGRSPWNATVYIWQISSVLTHCCAIPSTWGSIAFVRKDYKLWRLVNSSSFVRKRRLN